MPGQWRLVAVAGFALAAVFAKQLCEFNAAFISQMPGPIQKMYRLYYLGRDPDDPFWVNFTCIVAIAAALVFATLYFASPR